MAACPFGVMRYTRAGAPVAAYTLPASSAAIAQMYVEGVAYNGLNAGASSKPPEPRIATPAAVPLVSYSNFDCSQVRLPSATAAGIKDIPRRIAKKRQ